jgi:protein-L-isoaspartate(D-aspartate) O-methyltransferase
MLLNQVRTWDFISPENINLMQKIQREEFVPVAHRKLAFSDFEIPMSHDQFMMKPIVEGRILQSLNLKKSDNVLEIGTGSAYLTALLALTSSKVTTMDIYQDFINSAHEKLQDANIKNTECICHDFYEYQSDEKFDCIVITGSIQETPEFLLKNLKSDGKIFAIIGHSPVMSACLITKSNTGKAQIETLFETDVKPLIKPKQKSNFKL